MNTTNRRESDNIVEEFQLVLHDLGNLAIQILHESTDKWVLDSIAEKMNYLFEQAGRGDKFKAEVHKIENGV